jgi:hypothetical protein
MTIIAAGIDLANTREGKPGMGARMVLSDA